MFSVHVYGHQNSDNPATTLTPLASINIRLNTLEEFMMVSFLSSLAPRIKIEVGLLYPFRILNASILGVPIHSNLSHTIVYKISKLQVLQYWTDQKLTHMTHWEEIDLTTFEQVQ